MSRQAQSQLGFLQTVSNLSRRILEQDDFACAVRESLADMGRWVGAGRCYLLLIAPDGRGFEEIHEWCADGVSPAAPTMRSVDPAKAAWMQREFAARRPICLEDVGKLVDDPIREAMLANDVRAVATLPIHIGEELAGAVGFDITAGPHAWSEQEVALLRMAADVLAQAVAHRRNRGELERLRDRLRKQLDRQIDEICRREQRIRDVCELVPAVISEIDLNLRFTYVNRAGLKLFGYSRADVEAGVTVRQVVHPDDWPRAQRKAAEALTGEPTQPSVYRMVSKDGREFYAILRSTPILRDGQVVGMRTCLTDITDRVAAEQALCESEKRYRGLIESQQDLIVRVDPEGRFTFVNDVFCRVFGRPREAILGEDFRPLVHPDDLPANLEALRTLAEPPHRVRLQQRVLAADGMRWLEWEACAIFDENGRLVEHQAAGRDITRERQVQEQLIRAHRQITNAQEEERRRLAKELHDSVGQNLIALQLLLRDLPSSSKRQGPDPTELCAALVREVRSVCRGLFPATLDSLGLPVALEELVETARAGGFRADLSIDAEVAEARFARDTEIALFRIAQEAVANAMQHSGGRRVAVELRRTGDLLVLTVEDDGAGFDPASARRSYGLNNIDQRARSVGGDVTIESREGGTLIRAAIPAPAEG